MKESINLLYKRIKDNINILKTDLTPDELIELVKICTDKVLIENENVCFEQSHGAPMGGGLGGILSDIYMEYLEEKIFKICKKQKWKRYRDDTLMKWNPEKDGPISKFVEFLNNIDPYLKFTYEIEKDFKISFFRYSYYKIS